MDAELSKEPVAVSSLRNVRFLSLKALPMPGFKRLSIKSKK
jgi:hypothetical protein